MHENAIRNLAETEIKKVSVGLFVDNTPSAPVVSASNIIDLIRRCEYIRIGDPSLTVSASWPGDSRPKSSFHTPLACVHRDSAKMTRTAERCQVRSCSEHSARLSLWDFFYQPRSRGDNTFGSVRVCACVCCLLYTSDAATIYSV